MPEKTTPLSNRIQILSDLWLNYRNEPEFEDFIEYNDLGLPLAYILQFGLATANDKSASFVNETFDLFVEALGIEDDEFNTLDEMFAESDKE